MVDVITDEQASFEQEVERIYGSEGPIPLIGFRVRTRYRNWRAGPHGNGIDEHGQPIFGDWKLTDERFLKQESYH